jgi:hypothetical protein
MHGHGAAFHTKSVIRQGVLETVKKRNEGVAIVKNNCIFAPAFGAPKFNVKLKIEN